VSAGQVEAALWGHQREALRFVEGKSAVLLHCGMGTGKSRIAIEAAIRSDARKVLILSPLSVVEAWSKQFFLYADSWVGFFLSKGSVKDKQRDAQIALKHATLKAKPCVIVVNYESARSEPFASWARSQAWDLLIMDESHRLKSYKGRTAKWVARLAKKARKRLALTGTPMPHSPLDIYQQFLCLDPNIFGASYYRFRGKYAKMGGYAGKEVVGYKNTDELRQRIASITYQATRSVLDLPPAVHETRLVALGKNARRIYDQLDKDFYAQVGSGEITAANALVKLLRLQQTTGGYVPVDEGDYGAAPAVHQIDCAKEDALVELLTALQPSEPVAVFARFSGDLLTVHKAAKRVKRRSLELSGKRKELEAWQSGAAPILAVQIQAGGVGIDLTRCGEMNCAYTVYLSVGHNLGDYEQSLARVHRPGQERTVFYYHIVAENTVDVKVYRALRDRKNIVESVMADVRNKLPLQEKIT
tara:strand:+ start:5075 stop:6493 length:1419 start_codon:yes stop_codon:yes gene_type:complete